MTLAQAQVIRGETGFTTYAGAFRDVVGGRPVLRHVVEIDAHEGPVYAADEHCLYFTALPRAGQVRVTRLALDGAGVAPASAGISVVPADTCLANGMTLGLDGSLVVCEQGDRSRRAPISRVDRATGATTTVVDQRAGVLTRRAGALRHRQRREPGGRQLLPRPPARPARPRRPPHRKPPVRPAQAAGAYSGGRDV